MKNYLIAMFLASAALAQEPLPLSKEKLLAWLREPEASRSGAELLKAIESAGVDFETTPETGKELGEAAAQRDPELARRIGKAASENWVVDLVIAQARKTASRDLAIRDAALSHLAQLVRERGVEIPYEPRFLNAVRDSGAIEQALTLIWPPEPPDKPRLSYQLWRTPRRGIPPAPANYDPEAVWGKAEMSLRVDGRVVVVLKHQSVFYNVACSSDLEVLEAKFSNPLPRLPADQWEYWVEPIAKPRGAIFACPADKRCRTDDKKRNKHERTCVWHDMGDGTDRLGFSPARFVVDDPQKGRDAYSLVFRWALLPYSYANLKADLARFDAKRMVDKVYIRGVAFILTPEQEAELEQMGSTKRLIAEIKGNKRENNRAAVDMSVSKPN